MPPRTLAVLAVLLRSQRSKMVVTLDEGSNGAQFVSIKKFILGKQGAWIVARGVSLQLRELDGVAGALRSAQLRTSGNAP